MDKRYVYDYDEETEEETQRYVENFSPEWANVVEGDLENANWHSALDAFSPLIQLLPDIYLSSDEPMQKLIEQAVSKWDQHF